MTSRRLTGRILSYGSDKLNKIKIWGNITTSVLVVYIHGGAWRDPNNTFDDAGELIQRVIKTNSRVTCGVSINYRLSPAVKHPEHINDVIKALDFIRDQLSFDSMVVVGHSAGAFLALQALVRDKCDKCSAIILVEGIYDLESLVEEYPDYIEFVEEAFGDDKSVWKQASPANGQFKIATTEEEFEEQQRKQSNELSKTYSDPIDSHLFLGEVVFVHSDEDELLSWNQTKLAQKRLFNKTDHPTVRQELAFGKHDEVFRSEKLAEIVGNAINRLT